MTSAPTDGQRRRTTALVAGFLSAAALVAALAVATVGVPAVQTFPVGDYAASSVSDVRGLAEAHGWVLDEDQVRSESAAAGTIISQDPRPLSQLPAGSLLAVVVSAGPPPRVVPQLVGLTGLDAHRAARSERLTVDPTYVDEPPQPEVISASSPFGTRAPRGRLYAGDAVIGGDTIGSPNEQALGPAPGLTGVVVSQHPPAGTKVEPGTVVRVSVSFSVARRS